MNKEIVGYYDEHGFFYCTKHARDKSEIVTKEDCEYEKCSVCGATFERSESA